MESGVVLPVLIVLDVDQGVELDPPHVGAVQLGPRHHLYRVGPVFLQLERDDGLHGGAVQDDKGEGSQGHPAPWVSNVNMSGYSKALSLRHSPRV